MIDWPEKLVLDIARRRCVLFLGSGVSANSKNAAGERPKTWVEVLKLGLNRLPNTVTKKQKGVVSKAINNGDLLGSTDIVRG